MIKIIMYIVAARQVDRPVPVVVGLPGHTLVLLHKVRVKYLPKLLLGCIKKLTKT